MPGSANIVDEENVDIIKAKPLLTVFKRPHDSVVGIIERVAKWQSVDPADAIGRGRRG
jgi:hypothetical protein